MTCQKTCNPLGDLRINDRGQQAGYQGGYYGTALWSLYLITAMHPRQGDGGNNLIDDLSEDNLIGDSSVNDFRWMTFRKTIR